MNVCRREMFWGDGNVGNLVEASLNIPVRVYRFFCDASSIRLVAKC